MSWVSWDSDSGISATIICRMKLTGLCLCFSLKLSSPVLTVPSFSRPSIYSVAYDKFAHFSFCLQMESIIERMQDENTGVSVKNVKTYMNKIPSVFTGERLFSFSRIPSHLPHCQLFFFFCFRLRLDWMDDEKPGCFRPG